jgi:hypothetical protein
MWPGRSRSIRDVILVAVTCLGIMLFFAPSTVGVTVTSPFGTDAYHTVLLSANGGPSCTGSAPACGAEIVPNASSPFYGPSPSSSGSVGTGDNASVGTLIVNSGTGPYHIWGYLGPAFSTSAVSLPSGVGTYKEVWDLTGAARLALDGRTSSAGTLAANFSVAFNISLIPTGGGSDIDGVSSYMMNTISCSSPCATSHVTGLANSSLSVTFSLDVPKTGMYIILGSLISQVGASETGTGDGWATSCIGLGSSVPSCPVTEGTSYLLDFQYP